MMQDDGELAGDRTLAALFGPMRFASCSPQARRVDSRRTRVSRTLAASNKYVRARARNAQVMRAILLASATITTLGARRARKSYEPRVELATWPALAATPSLAPGERPHSQTKPYFPTDIAPAKRFINAGWSPACASGDFLTRENNAARNVGQRAVSGRNSVGDIFADHGNLPTIVRAFQREPQVGLSVATR